jgi:hypothetical protein
MLNVDAVAEDEVREATMEHQRAQVANVCAVASKRSRKDRSSGAVPGVDCF